MKKTYTVEGMNSQLRHYLAQFHPKTKCYRKSPPMAILSIDLFTAKNSVREIFHYFYINHYPFLYAHISLHLNPCLVAQSLLYSLPYGRIMTDLISATTLPKIAVVGCGYWGKNIVRNVHQLGALSSVCDGNDALLQKAMHDTGAPGLSFEDVLKSDSDGIMLATPAATHFDLCKRALLAGKHVFVEKPISLDTTHAKDLCDLARDQKKILMVGHLLQYHGAFLKAKEMVSKGVLGRLQYLYSNRLNLGKFRSEENILWSFAPHDLSMILGLVGSMPTTVSSNGSSFLQKNIHDVTTTHMTFEGGVHAHIFVSWLHPFKEQKLVIIGERGMLVFDDSLPWSHKLTHFENPVAWKEGIPQPNKKDGLPIALEPLEPLQQECLHFIECIQKGTTPRTDGLEGLNVLRVLEAAQISLNTEKPIVINAHAQDFFKHESALVDEGATVGSGTKIWHFSHILKGVTLGKDCVIGQNVMIGPDVVVGDQCKIQNNVSLYKGITLEDGVFCGPSSVFTNVNTPRACIERKDEYRPTTVGKHATIGANATIVCGHTLGAYCLIGAGAVVTKDVPPHALMVGNPAKQIGWVSHAGERLGDAMICPREGRRYHVVNGALMEILEEKKAS